jgi:hypothetical protein
MLVSDLYSTVCDVLLERGGLQLGLLTVEQFLDYVSSVTLDYLQQSGLVKRIQAIPLQFGIAQYGVADWLGETENVMAMGFAVGESSTSDVSNFSQNWMTKLGKARAWFEDEQTMKSLSIFPAPNLDGNQVNVVGGGGLYGVAASAVAGADIDFQASAPMLGTISGESGSCTLLTAGPMYGTIADMVTTKSNLTLIGPASLFDNSPELDSVIELLPDTFAIYIGYGVLAKVFSLDGELKDEIRRRYCQARYDEGLALGQAVMEEEMMEVAQ